MTITNHGASEDRLIGGSTPAAARVEIHEMSMDGGVMRMRKVPGGLAIPEGQTVTLAPGGYHVMFIGLKAPFATGERIPTTLRFQKAGAVTVDFEVSPTGLDRRRY
jgi:copper(I)-binding protein